MISKKAHVADRRNTKAPLRPLGPQWRMRMLTVLALVFLMLTATSCYQQERRVNTPFEFTERQLDSLSFLSEHHYTNNYNFVVTGDSLVLQRVLPSEGSLAQGADSFAIHRGGHLVVADIRIIDPRHFPTTVISHDDNLSDAVPQPSANPSVWPEGSVGASINQTARYLEADTVWVQLANDTSAFGWVPERILLKKAQPDDPISGFISTFSDSHLIVFFGVIAFFSAVYFLRSLTRRKAHMVHLNDIPSFYPTLLCLLVAFSASLYAGIQTFVPQMWQHFYFHPTLNPFSVPMPLNLFLCGVWAMLIVAIAAADDVRHLLPAGEAMLYLGGLASMCAICYIVFSITSLYFVGYLLFIVYAYYALRRYLRHSRARFRCGRCGAKMQRKGTCPNCGAVNC